MIPNRQHWIAMLAKLVCPSDPPGAAKSLAAMLPMLADFPDGAWTLASLDHVAIKARRTPSYAELREALGEWWRDNRPQQATLAGPGDEMPHEIEERRRERLNRDWDDPEGIRSKVAEGRNDPRWMRVLGGIVARHAPQHLALVPPEFWPEWAKEQAA